MHPGTPPRRNRNVRGWLIAALAALVLIVLLLLWAMRPTRHGQPGEPAETFSGDNAAAAALVLTGHDVA